MDPQKLSTQELLQLCLKSHDEAMWTEFVRRFQPLIARVVNKCVYRFAGKGANHSRRNDLPLREALSIYWNTFDSLRIPDFCDLKTPILTILLPGQSNYLKASGIDTAWTH